MKMWLIVFSVLFPLVASAESLLKLPAFFSDQMVLQADKPAPIWGQAKPGAKIVVTLGELSAQGQADEQGNWRVEVPTGPAGGPWDLVIEADTEKQSIKDVLRGEVWLCSGQSNMVWNFSQLPNYAEVAGQANDPQIRFFRGQNQPRSEKQANWMGEWKTVSPQNNPGLSAVAYFFARQIREATGKPVGLLISAVGGTPLESWTDLETMEANPAFKNSLDRFAQAKAEFPARQQQFEKDLAEWQIKAKEAEAKGEKPPRRPRPPLGDNHMSAPANLYNGMIHPLVGYGIRGVLWYQGEANAGTDPAGYAPQFQAMIESWRSRWNEPNMPFYFVQLANFRVGVKALAVLRESQRQALQLPNTGMAVAIDIGDVADIHPINKKDVGERLARWALKNEYGKDVVVSGPLIKQATLQEGKVVLSFDYAQGLKTADGQPPATFEAAGADDKFEPIAAQIAGETIVVQPGENQVIKTLRYGWDSSPPVNVINAEGLPASPFTISVTP